jgi:hypothetical protein
MRFLQLIIELSDCWSSRIVSVDVNKVKETWRSAIICDETWFRCTFWKNRLDELFVMIIGYHGYKNDVNRPVFSCEKWSISFHAEYNSLDGYMWKIYNAYSLLLNCIGLRFRVYWNWRYIIKWTIQTFHGCFRHISFPIHSSYKCLLEGRPM